jgi:cysteine synthase
VASTGVPIFAKCEHLNPGGSVKDRTALFLIEDAEERGVLQPGATIVEATAGNTGIGLALVAVAKGYRLVCVLPEKMSEDKRGALRAMGATVVVTPNAPRSSPDNFRNVAERMAKERGYFLTDQFNNPANVRAHEETTALEILEQTGGKIGAFVVSAGTGGTITGVGRVLRKACPTARVVLADPIGSGLAGWALTGTPGEDGSYAMEGIGAGSPSSIMDRSVLDDAISVSDDDSFAMVKRLVQEEGLLVGGSAGTAVTAALRIAERDAERLRETGPVITLLPDSWDRYRAKPWMQALAAAPDVS